MMKEIIIRKAKLGDEKGIAEMTKEGLKRKNFIYTGTNKLFTKEKLTQLRKVFKDKKTDHYAFVAINKNNKLIGSCFFRFKDNGRLRHRVDLGWSVHPDYQGRGIGTKLLRFTVDFAKKKGFKKAEAEAAIENTASWKMARKLGFKIEGRKKKALLTDDGRYIDTYILGKVL